MHVGIRAKGRSFEHRRFDDLLFLLRAHWSVHGEARRKRNQDCSQDTHDEWTAERRSKPRGLGEEMERRERGSGRNRWRGSRSDRLRLSVGPQLIVQRNGRRSPCEERLENFGDRWQRNDRRQVSMRDAAFAVLGRRAVLFFVVVWMRVLVRVPVMMLFERPVKRQVGKRHDIEAQQPKRTGKRRPVCSSSGYAQLPTSRPWRARRRYCTRQVAHSQLDQPNHAYVLLVPNDRRDTRSSGWEAA
jgi:hypothetical protein